MTQVTDPRENLVVGDLCTHVVEGKAKVVKVIGKGVYALEILSRPGSYYTTQASRLTEPAPEKEG